MDNILCIIIRFAWVPLAALSLIATVFLVLRRQRETDLLERDRIGSRIKYPLILLVFSLVSIPFWDFLISGGLIPIECTTGQIIITNANTIKEFSNSSTVINIAFPAEGGFNSDVGFKIPRNAHITKAKIEIEHPTEDAFTDDFTNWDYLESRDGLDISQNDSGYIFLKARNLEVTAPITMEGTQVFDTLQIKKGGIIKVPQRGKLSLIVKGTLSIDDGGGIDASGKINNKSQDKEYVSDEGTGASGGGGGGYGGRGGNGGDDEGLRGGAGGEPYGSDIEPNIPGNDGARGGGTIAKSGSGYPSSGGAAGGVIRIEALKIFVDGYISADGGNGEDSTPSDGTAGGGGGSGGSIILIANNLMLNGQVTANGGNGGNDRQSDYSGSDGGGGGGSGGRIAITYTKNSTFGTVSVNGGIGGKSYKNSRPASDGQYGQDGTIVWKQEELRGMSIVYTNITSKALEPDNLKEWKKIYANWTDVEGSTLKFKILYPKTNETLCDIDPKEALHGYDVTECISGKEAVTLQAEVATMSITRSSRIYSWSIHYDTAIKDLEMDSGGDLVPEYENESFTGTATISDENTNPRLSDELNKLSKDCDCRGCTPTEDYCLVQIRFSTKSSGQLIIKNPEIEYSL